MAMRHSCGKFMSFKLVLVLLILALAYTMISDNRYVDHDILQNTGEINVNAISAAIDRSLFTEYDLFEPEVFEDLETTSGQEPRIPHIIHQTYKDELVPGVFVPYIRSFEAKNPTWKHYFWTDKSARNLISDRFPEFLPIWDNYKLNINRADAIRYFVLYEFGGIYIDLDVECLRPLDRATYKYAAIFPAEPVEHSGLVLHLPFLINNAIMLSRPKHPFVKQMIDSLSSFQAMIERIDTAGPAFVTVQFMQYNKFKMGDAYKMRIQNNTNSPYFYKGELPEDDINGVYVPNSHYFMHTVNQFRRRKDYYSNICKNRYKPGDVIIARACREYWLRSKREIPNKFTFTEHHWYQSYNRKMSNKGNIHFSKILKNYTVYPLD